MSENSFTSEDLSGESVEENGQTKGRNDEENNEEENNDEKMMLELINSISSALTTILEGNEKLENYKEIVKKQSKMVFSAKSVPNISIKDYLIRIQTYSGIETSTLILSLILIDHICRKSDLVLTYYNIHRILFCSVLIAIKYNEDSYYDNKFYSEIAGVKLKELKVIEYTFLELNDFNVYVNKAEFERYKQKLESFNKLPEDEKI